MASAAHSASEQTPATTSGSPKLPTFLMGVGLGGFVDGILLHQILQWHHFLTGNNGGEPMTTVAGLEANTLADGLFHIVSWVFVAIAMLLVVRAWQRRELAPPWRGHVGMLLAGWGGFNLVEGLVNHHILGIHHSATTSAPPRLGPRLPRLRRHPHRHRFRAGPLRRTGRAPIGPGCAIAPGARRRPARNHPPPWLRRRPLRGQLKPRVRYVPCEQPHR